MEFNHPGKLEAEISSYLCDLEPQIDKFLNDQFNGVYLQQDEVNTFLSTLFDETKFRLVSIICDKLCSEVRYISISSNFWMVR